VTLPRRWADHYVMVFRSDAESDSAPLPAGTTLRLSDRTFALLEAIGVGADGPLVD
jgi:hypothetical protein